MFAFELLSSTIVETDYESDTDKASNDSEIEVIEALDTANEKRRAKSRSPTPPPRLPQAVRQHVLNVIDSHFAPSNDALKYSEATSDAYSIDPASLDTTEDVTPGSAECVTVQIKWEDHPYDETAKLAPPKLLTFHQHRVGVYQLRYPLILKRTRKGPDTKADVHEAGGSTECASPRPRSVEGLETNHTGHNTSEAHRILCVSAAQYVYSQVPTHLEHSHERVQRRAKKMHIR